MKPGEILEVRYTIVRELKQGGMGQVFLAMDNGTLGHIAVKTILQEFADRKDLFRRFKREVRILKGLHHQNIVKMLHADFDHKPPYYMMEFCEEGSITTAASGCDFSYTLKLFLEACAGIEFAHKHGILHRDIKPDNILVDGKGTALVTDFGLGLFLERDTTPLTPSGLGMGTPRYMAPEQLIDAKHVNAKADIYSLGLVLSEILTGGLAVDSDVAMVDKIKHRFADVPTSMAQDLVREIKRATWRDTEGRHQSVAKLIESLNSICVIGNT